MRSRIGSLGLTVGASVVAITAGVLAHCTPASGSTFGLGTTAVMCTATNLCSTNSCSFNVTVAQVAAVSISCPANLTTNICGPSVEVTFANPVVGEAC